MKLKLKLTCLLLLLLAGIASAEKNPPEEPRPQLKSRTHGFTLTAEPNVVHNTPSYSPKLRDPIRDWKFWAGTGVALGAMGYDWEQTLSHQDVCPGELNSDNPFHRVELSDLAKKDLPIQLGLFGVKYLVAKKSRKVPRWSSYIAFDAVPTFVHLRAGSRWNACR